MTDPLAERVQQRPGDGPSARTLLREDREWAVCFSCPDKHGRNVRHPLRGTNATPDYHEFASRHPHERGHLVLRIGPEQMERSVRAAERRKRRRHEAAFLDNASVTESFGTLTSIDITAIGIATSVTAGWCSCWVDNSSSLAIEIVWWYYSQAVNTAASSQKAHFLWTPGSQLSADLPTNTAGNTVTNSSTTSATHALLDITANASGYGMPAKVCPYITTNKAISSNGLFGTAKSHDGICPKFVWLAMINAAGPTIGTGGGTPTVVKYATAAFVIV